MKSKLEFYLKIIISLKVFLKAMKQHFEGKILNKLKIEGIQI